MSEIHKRRIQQIKKTFVKGAESSALVLGSAPVAYSSRDARLPYRQDSDFYYLTGCKSPKTLLLITSEEKSPIILAAPEDEYEVLYEGAGEPLKPLARKLGATLITTANPKKEVLSRLKGIESLYFQNTAGSFGAELVKELTAIQSHNRGKLPGRFLHSDAILERMRLHKSADEVDNIYHAARVTCQALHDVLPLIRPGASEFEIAASLEYMIKLNHCDLAFPSIVAAGRNGATLHAKPSDKVLQNGELLLLDVGAQYNMYNADMTRVIPVGDKLSAQHMAIWEIVLEAERAAVRTVKHGVTYRTVQNAALEVLTEGLRALNVLRGKTSKLIADKAYLPFFPHSIGHPLGLDVHDVGSFSLNPDLRLEEGMVITIEPGLYFRQKIGKIPSCGVRIEDDILVTKKGCKILTEDFPRKPEGVLEALQSAVADNIHDHTNG